MSYTLEQRQHAFAQLRTIKSTLAAKGWFPATSGNLSIRIGETAGEHLVFAITASGKDKAVETPEDFLVVNMDGQPLEATALKPSAETLIHREIYKYTEQCGAIFHVHTIFNNIISERYGDQGYIPVRGVELIKAFNIWEENAEIRIPVLPNHAHIPSIAELVERAITPGIPGIILRNHGIYAWGRDVFEAKRHLEAFEFLFEHIYYSELLPARK